VAFERQMAQEFIAGESLQALPNGTTSRAT
jgi:hypothetical protein